MSATDLITPPAQLAVPTVPHERTRVGVAAPSAATRLHGMFEARCDATPHATALECGARRLTYRQLDEAANRLAHRCVRLRVGEGSRVGICLERSVETYVALLAVLKAGAAFVPIDATLPTDRVGFMTRDAGLEVLITSAGLRADWAETVDCTVLELDLAASPLVREPATRLPTSGSGDPLCYVIYTSGSSGRPKGVEISHASICNFLSVVEPLYDVRPKDRVYQGMTIAFDFSIEEIWPTWLAGATLVAGPTDHRRLGPGLAEFLTEQRITVLCAVPTLLASLDRDVPSLRLLNLGGESCPSELVTRWHRPHRRILNTYGPTETTVTATWTELVPERPVTIGRALPSYSVHLLDEGLHPVAPGEVGEICIGGPGVARGYVGLPELTEERFVADPFNPDPSARLYRSGDLGRLTPNGEIEFMGRCGSEVKLRGYRIDLAEIESVLLQHDDVRSAAVTVHDHPRLGPELAAYVACDEHGAGGALREQLAGRLGDRLPTYMLPSFIEIVDAIPTLPSGKVDRRGLPATGSERLSASGAPDVSPESELEAELAQLWGDVLGARRVSVEADFFLDLGGHSLAAAIVVSRLRSTPGRGQVAIGDIYAHPTIRRFAAHLEATRDLSPARSAPANGCASASSAVSSPQPSGRARLVACTLAQALLLYLLFALIALPLAWVLGGQRGQLSVGLLEETACLLPVVVIGFTVLAPVAASRALLAGLGPGRYRLWGTTYVRWWLARKLLTAAPLTLLSGSPLLPCYLRLLGARVGRGCHLATGSIDLPRFVELGDDVHIGAGAVIQPFTVEGGWLNLATVRLGAGSFVGANAVVLAGASVGDGAGLGEQSLAHAGQEILAGEWWAGAPSTRQNGCDPSVAAASGSAVPAPSHWSPRLIVAFVVAAVGLELLPWLALLPAGALVTWATVRAGAWGALAGLIVAPPLYVLTVCGLVWGPIRLASSPIRQGIFALRSSVGYRKWLVDKLLHASLTLTNTLYATLYTAPWLRALGAAVGRRSEVSTLSYVDPVLLDLGEESFVADLASVGAATYAAGRVVLARTSVGRRSFVGNAAVLRSGTSVGPGSLVGAHTLAPAGDIAPATSWLGSPAIFLPRRQGSGDVPEHLTYVPSRRRIAGRLAIEYARITLPAMLLGAASLLAAVAELYLAATGSLIVLVALTPVIAAAAAVAVTLAVALLKWTIVGRYRPRVEPLWSTFVRRSELVTGLYEGAAVPVLIAWLTGTALMGPALRLFGTKVGRRVWLDTTFVTEFDLVTVHDDAAVGALTSLQTHLFEDRVMKMSTVNVGAGSSVGARSVVLYDSEIGAAAVLDGLSLVMKGECLPAGSRWRGIPASGAR